MIREQGRSAMPPYARTSRRQFLCSLAAFSGVTVLAACGSAPPNAAAPTTEVQPTQADSANKRQPISATPSGEPKRGGTYRTLNDSDFPTLDAAKAFGFFDWWASYLLLYNRLYTFDLKGELFPDLAEALPEISADGLIYTIKLRNGVTFHDGSDMTAEDVKFSFDRNLWKETESAGIAFLDNIVGYEDAEAGKTRDLSGVKVLDPSTIQFTLKRPQAVFTDILAVSTFGIVPKQAVTNAGADWGTKTLVGTGPFKLAEWKLGESISFERNPNYFRSGKPYLDRIEAKLNVKREVGVLQWEAGEIDFANQVPSADLARIRGDATLSKRLREEPGLIWFYLQFANNAKPFDDLRVRQAIAMALDKANLARRSQIGTPTESMYLPGIPQYDPQFKSNYQYDPEKAKQLLKAAGVPEGFKVSLFAVLTKELAEVVQADLKAVGLDPELLTLDGTSYDVYEARIKSGEIPLTVWGFGYDYFDGSNVTQGRLVCGSQPAPSDWCDPDIAKLAQESDSLPRDDPRRTEVLRKINNIVVNEKVLFVPLFSRNNIVLSQGYVRNDLPHSLFPFPVAEDVWLDP